MSPGDASEGRSADAGGARLDRAFAALSHPTRRSLLQRLGRVESANVTELAEPYGVTLMAVSKHLKVLGEAGLVDREAVGRERRYALRAEGLAPALSWLLDHREFWTSRLDSLAAHLEVTEAGDETDPHNEEDHDG